MECGEFLGEHAVTSGTGYLVVGRFAGVSQCPLPVGG